MKQAVNNICGGGLLCEALRFQKIWCIIDRMSSQFHHQIITFLHKQREGKDKDERSSPLGVRPWCGVCAHFVSSWSESSCFRCLESSFFSMERRTQALALPTSVLISLMFWMCLKVKHRKFTGSLKRAKLGPFPCYVTWKLKVKKPN